MRRATCTLFFAFLLALCVPAAAHAGSDGGVCAGCPGGGAGGGEIGEAGESFELPELRRLTREVGFREPRLAAAIAMAESGGLVRAKNRNRRPRSVDRGLFQINSHWHPEVTRACAFDALCNARAALRISRGGRDWSEWNAYRNRSYRAFL
jgi:hypothetical protein